MIMHTVVDSEKGILCIAVLYATTATVTYLVGTFHIAPYMACNMYPKCSCIQLCFFVLQDFGNIPNLQVTGGSGGKYGR